MCVKRVSCHAHIAPRTLADARINVVSYARIQTCIRTLMIGLSFSRIIQNKVFTVCNGIEKMCSVVIKCFKEEGKHYVSILLAYTAMVACHR